MRNEFAKHIIRINKIELININHSYNGAFTLRVDKLVITPGKYLIIGPNGAGKTTLLHIISGLIKPSNGRVVIDEYFDITDLPDQIMSIIRRKAYAILLQEDVFIDNLSLRQNLELPYTLFNEEPPRKLIETLSRNFKIDHLMNRKPDTLSGGEKRKASIVRTLAKASSASIILLDEPTSNLDEDSVRTFIEIIKKIENKIVLIATHDMELMKTADATIFMRNGQIISIKRS